MPSPEERQCLICRADRQLLARRIREAFPPAPHLCGACGGSMAGSLKPCVRVFRTPRPYLSHVRYHGLPEPFSGGRHLLNLAGIEC